MSSIVNRKTVDIGNARVTVRSSSAWALADADVVRNKMILEMGEEVEEDGKALFRVNDIEAGRLAVFTLLVVNTEKIEGIGFKWPLPSATAKDLVEAYQQLGDRLTALQLEAWQNAIREVDQPPGDPDLAPGADPNSDRPKS